MYTIRPSDMFIAVSAAEETLRTAMLVEIFSTQLARAREVQLGSSLGSSWDSQGEAA